MYMLYHDIHFQYMHTHSTKLSQNCQSCTTYMDVLGPRHTESGSGEPDRRDGPVIFNGEPTEDHI